MIIAIRLLSMTTPRKIILKTEFKSLQPVAIVVYSNKLAARPSFSVQSRFFYPREKSFIGIWRTTGELQKILKVARDISNWIKVM
ncbi:MAG: hypothetical protein HGA69_00805 [Desulfobulbaceae bacterium]|nr:hypothetical protein [Desulfobulbaceae bacterium]